MINTGKEWDWMDDKIQKDIYESLLDDLKGWGFDTDRLMSKRFKDNEWCHYGGLPSPKAYE